MNKGPMSRMKKVPVRCSNCGKIKYNVVYEEAKNTEEKKIKEKEPEKVDKVVDNKPIQPIRVKTHYINDIIAHQRELADKYNFAE